MTRWRMASLALMAALAPRQAIAQAPPGSFRIEALPTPTQPGAMPLYPESPPSARVTERWNRTIGDLGPMHIDQRSVRNVTRPTITPVLPDPTKATGAAVIVAPGGAFLSLSIDSEGMDVARALADRGIAAFVLKYRLNETPADDRAFMALVARTFAVPSRGDATPMPTPPQSLADASCALALVRQDAARWGIDPVRVGMIGFSAGAQTVLAAALTTEVAARPAFVGYIYGPMKAIAVPADAPPLFAAFALDDGLFGRQGFGVVEAWQRANRPVELHAYEHGDHGFGLGRPGTTTTLMIDEYVAWLASHGWLARSTR